MSSGELKKCMRMQTPLMENTKMHNYILGSCPHCGGNIWYNDEVEPGLWKCLRCRMFITWDELIPF